MEHRSYHRVFKNSYEILSHPPPLKFTLKMHQQSMQVYYPLKCSRTWFFLRFDLVFYVQQNFGIAARSDKQLVQYRFSMELNTLVTPRLMKSIPLWYYSMLSVIWIIWHYFHSFLLFPPVRWHVFSPVFTFPYNWKIKRFNIQHSFIYLHLFISHQTFFKS